MFPTEMEARVRDEYLKVVQMAGKRCERTRELWAIASKAAEQIEVDGWGWYSDVAALEGPERDFAFALIFHTLYESNDRESAANVIAELSKLVEVRL